MPPGGRGRLALPADMVGKWSSKPAGHQAARLRNNQRRHRERARAHIADLEARLADTQRRLYKAKAQICALSDELAVERTHSCSTQPNGQDTSNMASSASNRSSRALHFVGEPNHATDEKHGLPSVPSASFGELQKFSPLSGEPDLHMLPILPTSRPLPGANACTSAAVLPAPMLDTGVVAGISERDCCDLPAPKSGQSTVRCQDAYTIIVQQNHKGLDVYAIRKWLEPGFRGPIVKGDGCRVETHLLFALLDFISSS